MRLIDADALELEGWHLSRHYVVDSKTGCFESKAIKEVPTAQPDDAEANYWHEKANSYEQTLVKLAQSIAEQPERKKGRWIPHTGEEVDGAIFSGYRCSVCNYWKPMGSWNFCPNCGADMRGDRDETD